MEPNLFDDFHMNSDFTENYTDIWSDNSHQVFESELSNNLQGILPMFGNNNTHFDHDQDMVAKICHSEHQYFEAASSPTVEIIQVDPNEYDNDSDDEDVGVPTESSYDETSSIYDSDADLKRLEPTVEEDDSYSSSSDDENWPAPPINTAKPGLNFQRVHRKSFSLPDSPVHCQQDDLIALQPSLTFEDLHVPKPWSIEPPKRVPPLKLKNLTSLSQQNILQTKSKRQCVSKVNYKTTLSKPILDSDSDSSASDVDVGVETAIFSNVTKRQPEQVQSKDNFKKDPTWSPTKIATTAVVTTREAKKATVPPKTVSNTKPKPVKPTATVVNSSVSSKTVPLVTKVNTSAATPKAPAAKLLKVNPINKGVSKTKVGLLNAAEKYSKNMLNAVTKPLKPTSKLDHDYCTLKRQSSTKPTITTVPRKTIEIPIDFNVVSKPKARKVQKKNGGATSVAATGKPAAMKVAETKAATVEEPPGAVKVQLNRTPDAGVSTKNGDSIKCDSNASNANNCSEPTEIKSNSCNSNETTSSDPQPEQVETVVEELIEVVKKTPKKKLNLAEYKKRRGNALDHTPLQSDAKKHETSTSTVPSPQPQAMPAAAPPAINVVKPEANSSTPKVKTFLNVNNKNQYVDPISAAQKKVLRQHALKKQALEKSAEAQILKAIPLLPILPLAELAGCADTSVDKEPAQKEYEEIIIVSIACNTDITIPINTATETLAELYSCNNGENISANSLLSSIQDVVIKKSTMDQVPMNVAVVAGPGQISPNIGVSPSNQFSPGKPETSKSDNASKVPASAPLEEAATEDGHGEDKVIMHLKKGRVLPKMYSIACQTINLPQFPLLKRLKPTGSRSGHRRDKRKRNYRVRNDSHSTDGSDEDSAVVRRKSHSRESRRSSSPETTRRRRYSSRSNSGHSRSSRSYDRRTRSRTSSRRHSSRSSSRSHYERRRTLSRSVSRASEDGSKDRSRYHQHQQTNHSRKRYRNCSTSSGSQSSSYSSRSKSRSRSVSPKRQKMMTDRAKSPDERRIVYVGRIENELTKDELKQKFKCYGDIKQVTLHFKDSGIRYGFVTFDKPQDAFAAIDASTKDTNINMYDISFGGRRQFCRAQYSDLDGLATTNTHDPVDPYFVPRTEKKEESFEEMLKKLKAKMSARQS